MKNKTLICPSSSSFQLISPENKGQTDRQAGRQADNQIGRQSDRQAGKQADRQIDRQTYLYLYQQSTQHSFSDNGRNTQATELSHS